MRYTDLLIILALGVCATFVVSFYRRRKTWGWINIYAVATFLTAWMLGAWIWPPAFPRRGIDWLPAFVAVGLIPILIAAGLNGGALNNYLRRESWSHELSRTKVVALTCAYWAMIGLVLISFARNYWPL